MAITRRQFVTRLGAMAAAMGLGQADISRLSETFAYKLVDRHAEKAARSLDPRRRVHRLFDLAPRHL